MAKFLNLGGTTEQTFLIGSLTNGWTIDASGPLTPQTLELGNDSISFSGASPGDVMGYDGSTWGPVTGGGGGANTTLSNLDSPTAINQALIPNTTGDLDLGSTSFLWRWFFATEARAADNTTIIDFENRVLHDSNSDPAVNFNSTTELVIPNRNVVPDDPDAQDIGTAALYWANGYFARLRDSSDVISVGVNDRTLKDISGADSINWDSKILYDPVGENALVYNFSDQLVVGKDQATNDSKILFLQASIGGVGIKAANSSTGTYTLPTADGSSGDVLSTDGSGNLSWVPGGGGGAVNIYRGASVAGTLIVQTNAGLPIYFPENATIQKISAHVRSAPTGSDIIIDVNLNGTTIFTTQANRPTIPDGMNADASAIPDVTAITAGDVIEIDVDQIGSGFAGEDLTVIIQIQE